MIADMNPRNDVKFILFSATDVNLVLTFDDHHLLDFLLPQ